jgi:hypothetical protein
MGTSESPIYPAAPGPSMDAASAAPVPPSTKGTLSHRRIVVVGGLLLVDLLLTVVMLATDKNLQTDFGSVSPYYLHWYLLLATGIIDLVAALVLLASAMMASRGTAARPVPRWIALGGLAWPLLVLIGMVGIIATWSQAGFSSANQFAQYLFQTTSYPGALSYIPWLYDLLLAMYVLTPIAAAFSAMRSA